VESAINIDTVRQGTRGKISSYLRVTVT